MAAYQRPRLRFQPVIPELWVEARGMVKRVNAIAHEYGVQVWSSGGMDHLEAKHRLARRWSPGHGRASARPSSTSATTTRPGRTILRVLEEDVTAMAEDIATNAGKYVTFERLWITTPQAWEFHAEGKSQGIDPDGLPEVQAEAVPIAGRPAIIRAAIEAHINVPLYERVRDHGLAERRRLMERTHGWGSAR